MVKYNYYGLKNGDLCFVDEGRKEKGFFHIFSDGSYSIVIKKDSICCNNKDYDYIFGNLQHIKYLIYKYDFFKFHKCTDLFLQALKMYGVKF